MPVTTSYDDYTAARASLLVDTSVTQHEHGSYTATPIANPGSFFACDDPTGVVPFMPSYPPLQPAPVGVQPSVVNREEMVYPVASTSPNQPLSLGLGIQDQSQLMSHERPATIPDAFEEASYLDPQYGAVQRYASASGHELVKGTTEMSATQEREPVPALPRLPTARRGPFKDHDQREKTARTRKIGSCIRCRIQRIRVSIGAFPYLLPLLSLSLISGCELFCITSLLEPG